MGNRGRNVKYVVALLLTMVMLCGTTPQKVSAKNVDLAEEIQADVKPVSESGELPTDAWFLDDLNSLCEKCPNIFVQTGGRQFYPKDDVSRAESAIMLYRIAGRPPVQDSTASAGRWFDNALCWAHDNGIMMGYGKDDLAADDALTREQLAVVLYRYAQLQEGSAFGRSSTSLASFYDSWRISPWAYEAMQWAVSSGIMQGNGNDLLRPRANTTQAEIISALSRFLDGGVANSGEKSIPETEPIFHPKFLTVESTRLIDAPFIDQREKYPTGCESVSSVMALQYLGVDITPEAFIDTYLPIGNAPYYDIYGQLWGCDPLQAFPGSPYSYGGWGCYSPVIYKSLKGALADCDTAHNFTVKELVGCSLEGICSDYIDNGVPVVLWATVGMAAPQLSTSFLVEGSGNYFTWVYPLHCLLLVGRDDGGYYFNDPLSGKAVRYTRESAEQAYRGLGQQAILVLPV